MKIKAPEQREADTGPIAQTAAGQRQDWAAWCTSLIDAGATGRLAYARAYMSHSRHGKDLAVVAWLARCKRSDPKASILAAVNQAADDLAGSWREYGGGMRKLGLALVYGAEIHRRLYRLYPWNKNALTLSRDALGENLPRIERKARWRATVAECVELLPPRPASDAGERARRAGITDEQRMANADATAAMS